MSFLRWLAGKYLFTFTVFFFMLGCGVAAVFLSEHIIEFFGLGNNSGMYLKLGLFVVIVGVVLWAYDKYREWRFFRDE